MAVNFGRRLETHDAGTQFPCWRFCFGSTMKTKLLALLVVGLSVVGCSGPSEDVSIQREIANMQHADTINNGFIIDPFFLHELSAGQHVDTVNTVFLTDPSFWGQVDPLSFLDTLSSHPARLYVIVVQPDPSWFNALSTDQLTEEVTSTIPSGQFILAVTSYSPHDWDTHTRGMEAERLLRAIERQKL